MVLQRRNDRATHFSIFLTLSSFFLDTCRFAQFVAVFLFSLCCVRTVAVCSVFQNLPETVRLNGRASGVGPSRHSVSSAGVSNRGSAGGVQVGIGTIA